MDLVIVLALEVPAPPGRVAEILTTAEGQRATWTADCDVGEGQARFGFPGAPRDLRADVTTEPDRLVRMRVIQGFPYWERSTWEWELRPAPGGAPHTEVLFRHTGLSADYPEIEFAQCAQTWARILDRLASYAEDGLPRPVFPGEPA